MLRLGRFVHPCRLLEIVRTLKGRKRGGEVECISTNGIFLRGWEGEMAFRKARCVGFVLGDEILLDRSCHCVGKF
jgi:hypothetical protein